MEKLLPDQIPYDKRVSLAIRFYGMYALGFSSNVSDCICAMDNAKVPWLYKSLTEEQREFIK